MTHRDFGPSSDLLVLELKGAVAKPCWCDDMRGGDLEAKTRDKKRPSVTRESLEQERDKTRRRIKDENNKNVLTFISKAKEARGSHEAKRSQEARGSQEAKRSQEATRSHTNNGKD